jgi:tetratricopeptide (TPR) repeat protein
VNRGTLLVLLVGVLVLASPRSYAQVETAPSAEQKAREAMERGVALFGRGEAEAALREYALAKTHAPLANVPYLYSAEALIVQKRYREAVTELEGYIAKNPKVSDRADVEVRIQTLRRDHFPGRVRFEWTTKPAEVSVTVDDVPVTPPQVLELSAGQHRLRIRGAGVESEERTIAVVGDQERTEQLLTTKRASAQLARPGEARVWPTVGWAGVGGGGAIFATSLVLDLTVLKNRADAYDTAAISGVGVEDARSNANATRTGILIGYGVGLTFAAAGALVLALAPSAPVMRDAARGLVRF